MLFVIVIIKVELFYMVFFQLINRFINQTESYQIPHPTFSQQPNRKQQFQQNSSSYLVNISVREFFFKQRNNLLEVRRLQTIGRFRLRFLDQNYPRRCLHRKSTAPRVPVRQPHRLSLWNGGELAVKRRRWGVKKRGRRHYRELCGFLFFLFFLLVKIKLLLKGIGILDK